MSVLRSLAVFLISILFTFTVFMTVTSYTLGDLIQKENLKTFIKTELSPSFLEQLEQQCEDPCLNFTGEQKQICMEICISELTNKTDIEGTVNKAVDEIYKKEFFNITINDLASLLSQFILFAVLAFISGALILVISEAPLTSLGKNLISVSISLFIAGFLPNLLMVSSNIPVEEVKEVFSGYLAQGLNQQTFFAIIFVVIGIVLIITDYIIKRRKKK